MFTYLVAKISELFHKASVRKSKLHKNSLIGPYSSIYETTIGPFSYLGKHCHCVCADIGKFCSIGNYCFIGNAEHPTHFVSTSPVFYGGYMKNLKKVNLGNLSYNSFPKRTFIGNDVFIGNNVIIKDGVKIGDGAIVAAGAVVTKDIPSYAIVGGVPSKVIKMRFSESLIKQLIDSQWWNLDALFLKENSIYMDDPEKFLERINKRLI